MSVKILTPEVKLIKQGSGLRGIFEQIEIAGRNCYASSHNIQYDENKKSITAEDFVKRMIKSEHYAMLEHGTVYLKLNNSMSANVFLISQKYDRNKYSIVNCKDHEDDVNNRGITFKEYFITTNLRVLIENGWMNDLQYLCEPTEFHEERFSFEFSTQIAITREMNRHRVNSVAEQSTRFCNYTNKKKFTEADGNISINKPTWIELEELDDTKFHSDFLYESKPTDLSEIFPESSYPGEKTQVLYEQETAEWATIDWWLWSCECANLAYKKLIELGWKPQQARVVLPLHTNTNIIHTASLSDWYHFLELRYEGTTGAPHPDIVVLSTRICELLREQGYDFEGYDYEEDYD